MAKYPALPVWTDAFLADTEHLSPKELGVYVRLLFVAWRRPKCDLPDDDKFLAKVTGCNYRQWRKIRPVMEQFHTIENCIWVQKRLQNECKKIAKRSEQQRNNVHARWNKNNGIGNTDVQKNGYDGNTSISISIPNQRERLPSLSGLVGGGGRKKKPVIRASIFTDEELAEQRANLRRMGIPFIGDGRDEEDA